MVCLTTGQRDRDECVADYARSFTHILISPPTIITVYDTRRVQRQGPSHEATVGDLNYAKGDLQLRGPLRTLEGIQKTGSVSEQAFSMNLISHGRFWHHCAVSSRVLGMPLLLLCIGRSEQAVVRFLVSHGCPTKSHRAV